MKSQGNKNIIVTGGAGYIGSHACKVLHRMGFTPITVDNLSTGWSESVKFGPLEQIDLLDSNSVNSIFRKYKPQGVMHFAASSQVAESVRDPIKYWRNNVLGSLNTFQACVLHGCKNIVFSSTCGIYGDQDGVLLSEESEHRPNNAYSASKRAAEELLMQVSDANNLNYVIFRYFNVAGADPEGEIGEYHRPETHLIPLILDVVDGKLDELTIFGTDYDTLDGTCIRDYVHVCDLVDAHVLGLKWLQDCKGSRVFNLGTGDGFSVRQVIEQVKQLTNRPVPVIEGQRRPGDCTKLVSGSTRAVADLGWCSRRSNLRQMVTDAWRWHQTGGYEK